MSAEVSQAPALLYGEGFCAIEVALPAGLQLQQAQAFVAGKQVLEALPVFPLPGRFCPVLGFECSVGKIDEQPKAGIAGPGPRGFRGRFFSSLFSLFFYFFF